MRTVEYYILTSQNNHCFEVIFNILWKTRALLLYYFCFNTSLVICISDPLLSKKCSIANLLWPVSRPHLTQIHLADILHGTVALGGSAVVYHIWYFVVCS